MRHWSPTVLRSGLAFGPCGRSAAALTAALLAPACGHPGGMSGYMGVQTAPVKQPAVAEDAISLHARESFWEAFHGDDFTALPAAITLLTAAYLAHPGDPKTALLLAHAHLWRISERWRDPVLLNDPRITDHLALAALYFDQAAKLAPGDARIPGWHGGVRMALGQVHNEQRMIREGYFEARDAASAWRQFNGFTFGYSMSGADPRSAEFREAVTAMWSAADACAGRVIDRKTVALEDVAPSAVEGGRTGQMRACFNSEAAPHNLEGFWLTMGDMLVRGGELESAAGAYRNATRTETYMAWRYQSVLQERLERLEALLRDESREAREPSSWPLMFNSAHACVACHAR